jgi:hypothetical protein
VSQSLQTTGNINIDSSAIALAILGNTAQQFAQSLIPLAELGPQGSVASNANQVLATTTSGGISIQWPCNGYAVGIRASTRDGAAASMAGMLLRVQVDGTFDLFVSASGNGAGFLPLSQIMSSANSLGRYMFRRRFTQATFWTIYLQNTTGGTLVADVAFDYINTSSPQP